MSPSSRLDPTRAARHGALLILTLLAATACRDGAPTGSASLPPPTGVGREAAAAKGGPVDLTPDGRRIGTLTTQGVDRTRYRVEYHQGTVMPATSNLYFIWYGNWINNPAQTILTDLATSLGGSQYFAISRLYPRSDGYAPSGGLIYGGAVEDLYSLGSTLSDQDVKSVVHAQLASGALPMDTRGIYVILASPDIALSANPMMTYCAMHDSTQYMGSVFKLAFIMSPARAPSLCAPQLTSPNGDYNADGMASLLAAEIFNAVVDPQFTAYYDRLGLEPADKCAWDFGTTYTAPNGSRANIRLGTRDYLLQRLWVPTRKGGHCAIALP